MTDYEQPISLLESRREALVNGIDCIDEQAERIKEMTDNLQAAHERLAASKVELQQIEAALGLLKAGAR